MSDTSDEQITITLDADTARTWLTSAPTHDPEGLAAFQRVEDAVEAALAALVPPKPLELDEAFQEGMTDALHLAIWGVLGQPFDRLSASKVEGWEKLAVWVIEQRHIAKRMGKDRP